MYQLEHMRGLPDDVAIIVEIVMRRGKKRKLRRKFAYKDYTSDWFWKRHECYNAAKKYYSSKQLKLKQLGRKK